MLEITGYILGILFIIWVIAYIAKTFDNIKDQLKK